MKKKLVLLTSHFFPKQVFHIAFKKATTPRKIPENTRDSLVANEAKKERIKIQEVEICVYKWGSASKIILLVHGWEGRASNFSYIIQGLLSEGYQVISFDAPSHGTSQGQSANLNDFTKVIQKIILDYRITEIICHSFGGLTTLFALSHLPQIQINKLVLIATPNSFPTRLEIISKKMGLSKRIYKKIVNRFEKELQYNVDDISTETLCTVVKVNNTLLIHDIDDSIVPFQESEEVFRKCEHSKLYGIIGTGHFKIMHAPVVFYHIQQFLKDE